MTGYLKPTKKISLYTMAALYVVAGFNHFMNPAFYTAIMPTWLGCHTQLIYISGGFEILLGLLLIPWLTRRNAAWCIIALLIAVFPANIQMLVNYVQEDKPGVWIALLRLPLQFLLIWWAYIFTKPSQH